MVVLKKPFGINMSWTVDDMIIQGYDTVFYFGNSVPTMGCNAILGVSWNSHPVHKYNCHSIILTQ